ncbi:MAG: TlpA family protein disulfide reductase [Muribaculaceae bacterium]|nr:TlpA family protein disulfide reductase [Muribaculaceae bacterium]
MRKIFIAFILLLIYATLNAQEKSKSEKLYLIDGYFFKECPVDISSIKGGMSIETADGIKAIGLLIKEPISEELKQKAISKDQIFEADILLDMYNESAYQMSKSPLPDEEKLKEGDKFPTFTATDIDGKIWTDTDIEGKVMVLNCWFTGCKPCRAEMPELSQWKEEMPDVMFFSSTYEKGETARPVLEKNGFNWIPIVNDTQFKEYVGKEGYPLTIVVDKYGKIAHIERGTSPEQRENIKKTIYSIR